MSAAVSVGSRHLSRFRIRLTLPPALNTDGSGSRIYPAHYDETALAEHYKRERNQSKENTKLFARSTPLPISTSRPSSPHRPMRGEHPPAAGGRSSPGPPPGVGDGTGAARSHASGQSGGAGAAAGVAQKASPDALQVEKSSTSEPTSIPMGEFSSTDQQQYQGLTDRPPAAAATTNNHTRTLSLLPLVFIIFYEVSGGPFGIEDSVRAAGPLLAILGFLVFPLIWSIPEALITAEMSTMFPENGGYVVWVSTALGPFWGFQQGWMKWLSGVIDNALYPVLFLDYLKSGIPALAGGLPRVIAVIALTVVLTYMTYRGLTVVGWVAICLGGFSILPFIVMGLVSIPKLRPKRWLMRDLNSVDWSLYLNTIFWNLNYWDSISTLTGEVSNPGKTMPKALFFAMILVVSGYLYPLLAGTGGLPVDRELWTDGYFSEVAKMIGGVWLSWWVQAAAAVSNMGMFVAEMSSDSYQLLGMAERGMLPHIFRVRSRYGTPILGVLFSASGVLLLSWLSFEEIVAAENFLYCFGMLLEFISFIKLRAKHPRADRPYKIPMGTVGSSLMLLPPTILMFVVLSLASLKVAMVSLGAVVFGIAMYPSLKFVEKKKWLRFSVRPDLPDFKAAAAQHDNI